MNQYYDFDQAFCPNNPDYGVAQCLKSHIQGNKFDSKASALMSEHSCLNCHPKKILAVMRSFNCSFYSFIATMKCNDGNTGTIVNE